MKKSIVVAAAFAVLIGGCSDPYANAETANAEADRIEAESASSVDAMLAANRVERKWSYHTSRDEMRGTETKFAELPSTDLVNAGWPYEATPMTMTLRKGAQGFDIYLQISGQFTCHSFSDDRIAAKFDEGPIEYFSCVNADSGANEVAFIGSKQRFLTKLRAAQKVTLEVPIFQIGRQQVSFDVAGLEWT